ncbi:MAG: RNA methyltransferase [Pseudomonadota bacterium]
MQTENQNNIVTIRELGRQGDGIAETADGPVYVPFTLAGEDVVLTPAREHREKKQFRGRNRRAGRIKASKPARRRYPAQILTPSPNRIDADCKHFTSCGGCQLQHFEQHAYLGWKQELVSSALRRENIDCDVEAVLAFGPHARRRAIFTAFSNAAGISLGFLKRDSHHITNIEECPVMVEEIASRLEDFRELSAILCSPNSKIKVSALACDNGLDVAVESEKRVEQRAILQAIDFAGTQSFARLSLDEDILIESRRPLLDYGVASVTPPPNGFVQAVAAAETAMAVLVCDHLGGCRSVADLFCGHGTFALRLAKNSTVYAAEASEPAISALDQAWRETGGALKHITTERRDLYRRPMNAAELKKIDGVVFDPPRAGAQEQAAELASSGVTKIAAVSCNPVTLARDLAMLIKGGYRLKSVTPIDQFIYTPHVEAVALLER